MRFPVMLAVTEGGEEASGISLLFPHANELLWGAIAFTIFFIFMSKFVFPRMNTALAERTANIEGKLQQAEAERAEAQRLLQQYQAKLEEANAESQRILDQARSNAARLEADLRAKAEEQAQRTVARATETIAAERDRALNSLRGEVGTLAIDLASRIVGEALDRDRHLHLVDQYIDEVRSSGARV